ncbi:MULTISPECIES: hypothetical protein [Comamonas]|uniref:hypothetical protein n=1 Tax=Comamonas TaxID=283 RepID=UPI0015FAE835|nr:MULTISPECIES: hypothetical protein [Comamonas]UUC96598.1 hypothetical protein NOX35_27190 [Comamonas sp. C11]
MAQTSEAVNIDVNTLAQTMGSYGVPVEMIQQVRALGRMQSALRELQAFDFNLRVEGHEGLNPEVVKIVESAFEL